MATTSSWGHLVSGAEKLLGGPAPFINLASILTSEAGFLASRARRLAATADHPFFSTLRACLRGQPVNSLLPISAKLLTLPPSALSVQPHATGRPSGGLITLLVGQCHAGVNAGSAKLCSQHRSLAELFETVNVALTIHKFVYSICARIRSTPYSRFMNVLIRHKFYSVSRNLLSGC